MRQPDSNLRCVQLLTDIAVLQHVTQRFYTFLLPGQAGNTKMTAVRDMDGIDSFSLRCQRRPDTDTVEDTTAAIGERDRSVIVARL